MNNAIAYIYFICSMLYTIPLIAQESDSIYAKTTNSDSLHYPIKIDTISCINFKANEITFNGADWTRLFKSMEELTDTTQETRNVISIIHLGDSHVQAGYFTEALRMPMQMEWGNAGRGFIAPLKISRSNEPVDYNITSTVQWKYSRCISGKNYSNRVGTGGISIEPITPSIDITFETISQYGKDLSFSKFILLHADTDSFPHLYPTNVFEELAIQDSIFGKTCYSWKTPVNRIQLKGVNSHAPSKASIYGAILENDNNGIIIHNIGNNSAMYNNYNNIEEYGKKLACLKPKLIIISLGTNESVYSVFNHERFFNQIDTLVTSIRKENPDILFLLTTPADNRLRKRKRNKNGKRLIYYVENTNLLPIVETIKEYGALHSIAVWDWYTISGGKSAYTTWIKEGGMKKDYIHYTVKGYVQQGNLLFHSIKNAYEQHIQ